MKVRTRITAENLERSIRSAAGAMVRMLVGGFVDLEGLEIHGVRNPIADRDIDISVYVAIARAIAPLKACQAPTDRALSCRHCLMGAIAAHRNRHADPQAWIYDDNMGDAMASILSA